MDAQELIAGLRQAGFRITSGRRAVCTVLAEGDSHLRASDVLERARVHAPRIDQSSVYRTLEKLEETGFLHHVHLGHGAGVYHVSARADHQHLVCVDCGRTEQVDSQTISPMLEQVAVEAGFSRTWLHFAIQGRCARCAGGSVSIQD